MSRKKLHRMLFLIRVKHNSQNMVEREKNVTTEEIFNDTILSLFTHT